MLVSVSIVAGKGLLRWRRNFEVEQLQKNFAKLKI